MMFPLATKTLIRGCKEHIAAGLGCAADYVADHIPLHAPDDGTVQNYFESGGGNWLRLVSTDGYTYEFAHLSSYLVATDEKVIKGQLLAITGNTGTITTGPHLHLQVFKNGVRVDPETLPWEQGDPMDAQKEARLSYLEGLFPGLAYRSPVYLTPDGSGHMLVTFKAEDQARTFSKPDSATPEGVINYVKINAINLNLEVK